MQNPVAAYHEALSPITTPTGHARTAMIRVPSVDLRTGLSATRDQPNCAARAASDSICTGPDCPRSCLEWDRSIGCARQGVFQQLSQPLPCILAQAGTITGCRPRSQRERLPIVVEVSEHRGRLYLGVVQPRKT